MFPMCTYILTDSEGCLFVSLFHSKSNTPELLIEKQYFDQYFVITDNNTAMKRECKNACMAHSYVI